MPSAALIATIIGTSTTSVSAKIRKRCFELTNLPMHAAIQTAAVIILKHMTTRCRVVFRAYSEPKISTDLLNH